MNTIEEIDPVSFDYTHRTDFTCCFTVGLYGESWLCRPDKSLLRVNYDGRTFEYVVNHIHKKLFNERVDTQLIDIHAFDGHGRITLICMLNPLWIKYATPSYVKHIHTYKNITKKHPYDHDTVRMFTKLMRSRYKKENSTVIKKIMSIVGI